MTLTTELISILVEKIKVIVEPEISNNIIENVIRRLCSFGYEIRDEDCFAIAFSIQKIINETKVECNIQDIPKELEWVIVDMVCGDFLAIKYKTGSLNIAGLNFDGAISSLSEGDTKISFDSSVSDEAKFNNMLNMLSNNGRRSFACYRKIQW